jgi:hypothetical protein
MTTPAPQTVEYWAISIFSSRTAWLNAGAFVIAVLSLNEVAQIVPVRFVPLYSALVAAINIYLRLTTVRPAVLIAPGTTAPIAVPKIDPPAPPIVTD